MNRNHRMRYLPLFVSLAAATCQDYTDFTNRWNVIVKGDLVLQNSDFEGRTYVGGTAHLKHFALGMKMGLQCSRENVLTANWVLADSGNFCGGKYIKLLDANLTE